MSQLTNTPAMPEAITEIAVGFLSIGQSCMHEDKLFMVMPYATDDHYVKLQSINSMAIVHMSTVVYDPKDEAGEPLTVAPVQAVAQPVQSINQSVLTPNQITTMTTYPNAQAIQTTKPFNTPEEYVAAVRHLAPGLAWETVTNWRTICDLFEIDFHTVAKGKARPAIDKVASELNGKPAKVAVSTKVKVDTTTMTSKPAPMTPTHSTTPVLATVVTKAPSKPAPAVVIKDAAKPTSKMPKFSDFKDEDEFDAAMDEWMLANPKQTQVVIVPAPQITVIDKPAPVITSVVIEEPAADVAPVAQAVVSKPAPKAKTVAPAVPKPVPVVDVTPTPIVAQTPAIEPQAVVVPVVPVAPKVQAVAAPVVQSVSSLDNIEETARQLATLLAGLKTNTPAQTVNPEDIAELVQAAIAEQMKAVNERIADIGNALAQAIDALKDQAVTGTQTIAVTINGSDATIVNGLTHKCFADVLKHVAVRDNVMLVGPAGSGKTTLGKQIAEANCLPFYSTSICAQTSKADIFGYMSASGQYVGTIFRDAYEKGGIFLLDEVDAGNANVLTALNAALDNQFCPFPDQMITQHPDFVCISGGNTYGSGANREYVGRNQLDSATLDRFSIVDFAYDEDLETAIAPDKTWCKCVQAIRKELANERIVVSPRATVRGGHLLAAGCTPAYVLQVRLIKGMAPALADRAKAVFARFYN